MKKSSKKKSRTPKVIITLFVIIAIILIAMFSYKLVLSVKENKLLNSIDTSIYASVNYYAIYGIHLNIKGSITLNEDVDDISLVLTDGDAEYTIDWILETEDMTYTFATSQYINEGINLETLDNGDFYLLIKTIKDEDIKYYSFINNTEYEDLEYYTITKNNTNNLITIEWNEYNTTNILEFTIKNTILPDDVYDITIDPGHDASDPGAVAYLNGVMYTESSINLEVSLLVKEYLEDMGYKVAITRDDESDELDVYGINGSATMANDTSSKFNLAIHHNSSGITGGTTYLKGLELYVANDSTFTLANIFVKNITQMASTTTSSKTLYKSADGIYQRYFTEEEIANDSVQPSKKTTNTIYYYNIREVGGISTNATNDGSYEPTYPANQHYNSNNTAEPFLLELGYLDNESDLINILNNQNAYAEAIATSIYEYLNSF